MPDVGRAGSKKATDYILELWRNRVVFHGHDLKVYGYWDSISIRVFHAWLQAPDGFRARASLDITELKINKKSNIIKWIIDPRLTSAVLDLEKARRRGS